MIKMDDNQYIHSTQISFSISNASRLDSILRLSSLWNFAFKVSLIDVIFSCIFSFPFGVFDSDCISDKRRSAFNNFCWRSSLAFLSSPFSSFSLRVSYKCFVFQFLCAVSKAISIFFGDLSFSSVVCDCGFFNAVDRDLIWLSFSSTSSFNRKHSSCICFDISSYDVKRIIFCG